MTLAQFETLVHSRRSVRDFRPDPVPPELLERLLNAARWAPSGYNLQPTHVTVVSDPGLKQRLHAACLSQRQVLAAPLVTVFSGDGHAYRNLPAVLAEDLAAGATSPQYAARLSSLVPLAFERGPVGLGWLWKALLPPVRRLFCPTPCLPAVYRREWLTRQVMLSAMNFMLAAHAARLSTVPMEGFDEGRVRRVVGLPRRHVICVIIPLGYAKEADLRKTRLPLERMVHYEGWKAGASPR
ncbi:MAG: nitroreductase family protein [Phycisphaerae bacterium]|nr:nitroreductase family protein [Phycisphaerae bacterium]MCZ2400765.1 nitroreductase family protein [Phycisphaerae bacterium]NUQ48576.1 nitroreductase family protein [Phycisphaerae bacterium]